MTCKPTVNRISAVLVIVMLVVSGGSARSQIGGYDILNMDFSARSSGMGGAFVGMVGDLNALFYNPAGIASIEKRSAVISYVDHVLDINSGNAVFVLPRKNDVAAFGVSYINYGDFEGRDPYGNTTANFSVHDVVATGGIARQAKENLFYGFAAKGLFSKIDTYSSSAFALDAGITYTIPEQLLSIGVSVVNIGFVSQAYDVTKDKLPMAVKAGFAKQLAHLPFLLSLEARQYFDGQTQIVGGGEFAFSEYLKGRFGYNSYGPDQKVGDEGGMLTGFSFGAGLYWRSYIIDYSYSTMGIIGNLNRLSLNFLF